MTKQEPLSAVLETTTLSPGVAPDTRHLISLLGLVGLKKSIQHDLNISFAGSPNGAVVRLSNPKSVPVGLLGGTLVTVSLSSSSVGSVSVSSSSIVSSSSSALSFIVGSSSVPMSGCVVNFETSLILCPFEYSTLKIRLTTRTSDKGNTSPYLVILFVE
jgi:hypothetical protein